MLVKTASLPLSYLLLVFFNGYLLINGDKGGTNIVVQGKSHEGGGGSVVVNSPKKGAQNIVIRDYRGTVVLNSHKKGGANIVVNSHEEKKPHHHHHEHHEQHHEQHHGHHAYESPKMLPMLGESGSTSSRVPSKLAFGARTVKPYESEETGEEEQLERTPTVSRKRKGGSSKQVLKKKLKAKVVREQSEETEDEQPKIRGRAKGDAEPEAEQEAEHESEPEADSSSSDAYSPSVAEEDPYSGYREGPGPIPQTDRKGLRDLEKGVEYGVEAQVEQQIEQQIEQGLLGQMGDDSSSDSNSGSSTGSGSSSSGSSGAGDSSSLDNLGLTGSDSGSDSPGYFASGFPSVDSFNTDSLKGLTLSDALFGNTDKDSSGSGLLDFPWTRRSDNPATINTENKSTPK